MAIRYTIIPINTICINWYCVRFSFTLSLFYRTDCTYRKRELPETRRVPHVASGDKDRPTKLIERRGKPHPSYICLVEHLFLFTSLLLHFSPSSFLPFFTPPFSPLLHFSPSSLFLYLISDLNLITLLWTMLLTILFSAIACVRCPLSTGTNS